ncbi:hypothetical protein [Planotetraspora silvatica]|uniref:hypothetical protein n=1 Tax=Planotetraspora silvatica TaxID=234614 RepID=UPI0031DACD3B
MQTAVLGSPDSDRPLSLPTERKEAEAYLSRYRGRKFYCGVLIGGCGWRLMDKLYGDRVCHFAHFPDTKGTAPECERRYLGADSADHLFIHRGLSSGLTERPRFEGRLEAGRCMDLLVRRRQTKSAIKVQFVNLSPDEWEQQDDVLRAQFEHVDWMLGPTATRTSKYLLERDGYALRVRCEEGKGAARVVKVGTETSDGDLQWSSLDDCEITAKGVVTPLLRKVRASRRPPAGTTTAALPGFPLAVKDIIVRPQEPLTRPISGPRIPPNSHVATVDVIIGDGEPINARIMVPGRLDLAVGQPYSLVEPASVDAGIWQGQLSPVWTIFSAGLVQHQSTEVSTPVPTQVTAPGSLPSAPVAKADANKSIEQDVRDNCLLLAKRIQTAMGAMNLPEVQRAIDSYRKTLARVSVHNSSFEHQVQFLRASEMWLREARARTARLAPQETPVVAARPVKAHQVSKNNELESSGPGPEERLRRSMLKLIADLRLASGKGDHCGIVKLLESNAAILAEAASHPKLRKHFAKIEAFRQPALVRADSSRKPDWALVDKCASLNKVINRAKSSSNAREVQNATDELRRLLTSPANQDLDLRYELRLLAEHEKWLNARQKRAVEVSSARGAAPKPDRTSPRQSSVRLQEIVDQLQQAELAGNIAVARTLLSEGTHLLMKEEGGGANSNERQQLERSAQWLAEVSQMSDGAEPAGTAS